VTEDWIIKYRRALDETGEMAQPCGAHVRWARRFTDLFRRFVRSVFYGSIPNDSKKQTVRDSSIVPITQRSTAPKIPAKPTRKRANTSRKSSIARTRSRKTGS
jgi:hypothetical protein